jgi:hypothetical protein
MRRRDFVAGVGSVVACPAAARAQQAALPVVGFLIGGSPGGYAPYAAAFRQGLKEGFVEGQNVAVEYRSAENQYDRLTVLAADLIQRKVRVIVASAVDAAHAAKAATTTIPIIFSISGDPVVAGAIISAQPRDPRALAEHICSDTFGANAQVDNAAIPNSRHLIFRVQAGDNQYALKVISTPVI